MRILILLCALCLLLSSLYAGAATSVPPQLGGVVKVEAAIVNLDNHALSDTFDVEQVNLDFQDVSEIDADKVILPYTHYSLFSLSQPAPFYYKNSYSVLFSYWLDKPPLFA